MESKEQEFNEQQKRAILRERFLKVLTYMENKVLEIDTYRGATVSGTFRSIDYDIENMHLNNLITPIGIMQEAILRTSDIEKFKFSF